jgi:hypothetical protein
MDSACTVLPKKQAHCGLRLFAGSRTVCTNGISRGRILTFLGHLLAISWSDGSVRLVGAESSKIVHHFSTGSSITGVTCMSWTSNLANRKRSSSKEYKKPQTWQDIFSAASPKDRSGLDLPRDLALIDIETSLPKLSVLASSGSSYVKLRS